VFSHSSVECGCKIGLRTDISDKQRHPELRVALFAA